MPTMPATWTRRFQIIRGVGCGLAGFMVSGLSLAQTPLPSVSPSYVQTSSSSSSSSSQSSHIQVEPNIEWQKLVSDDHNLGMLGDDLMGDMIDYNSGSVTFEHTDVDIPGNSGLSVVLSSSFVDR